MRSSLHTPARMIPAAVLLILLGTCSLQAQLQKSGVVGMNPEEDSITYELMIIDPDFDLWYVMKYSTAMDRSEASYQLKNRLAVLNWNSYHSSGRFPGIIDSYIDYRPDISYGIGLNRRLYWYFRFVEEKYHIPLLR
jgi:hypothetical protein